MQSSLATVGEQTLTIPKGATKHSQRLEYSEASSSLTLILEDGAKAHISQILTGSHSHFTHATEVILGKDATLTLLTLQNVQAEHVSIAQRSTIGDGATLHWQNVTLGGQEVTHELLSSIEGVHATSSLDWVFYAKDREKQKLSARNVFSAQNGSGEIMMKGIAEHEASVKFDGEIKIGRGGAGTNTYLTEQALMLDKTAKVDAVPRLEIKTNDVRASHSATVTRVSLDDLFYFSSRGIPEKTARQMYVLGFLGELTGRIEDDAIKAQIVSAIAEKYEGG